jgi:hypothetical protein
MKEIVIGYNPQRERELTSMADTIQKAFNGLVNAYATQGMTFSLNVEKALEEVSNEVKIGGQREIPQSKKLELLGINPEVLHSASYQLNKACGELGVEVFTLTPEGAVPSKVLTSIIKEQCEIKASGEKAIALAESLNEVIKSMEAFYAFMVKHQMNRPNSYAISQSTHGMIEADGEGKFRINPNAFSIYTRG